MAGKQILVLAPEDAGTGSLADLLRVGGHRVVVESNAGAAAASLTRDGVDLLVLDLRGSGATPAALASTLNQAQSPGTPPRPLDDIEREHILTMLRYTRGNKRRAAQLLGIARSTLIQKVRRYAADLPGELLEDRNGE